MHTVVTRMADRIPVFVVKNDRTGRKKVLHRARLCLWLTYYGEPMRCNLIYISDVPPGPTLDQCPPWGSENGDSVLGCSLQYGLDFTAYLAVIDDPERMSSKQGCEVHVGAPRNMAGQQITIRDREEYCPECLGSYRYPLAPCTSLVINPNSWGNVTGELAVTRHVLPLTPGFNLPSNFQ